MNTDPLSEAELDYVESILLKYGNDDSILDASELDGFFTALISGPEILPPSRWLPELWGGELPELDWVSAEMQRFMALLIQHMNNCVMMLMEYPAEFEALFQQREQRGETITIVEEWCFGYIRGVALGQWPQLPDAEAAHLAAIDLHGNEAFFPLLEQMSPAQHQQSVQDIEPAVRALHAYWLGQRSSHARPTPSPLRAAPQPGRNAPCPCGSGKKFKQCCLH
ncbi:YecA family protein [Pseudomonas sp.]|uniref:YecA/YgfB family protein n=1 Tax=Pseudomonas sp. TaxID=306 RepID=UPI003561FB4A